MAELILNVHDGDTSISYKNGDIIHAMNDLHISNVHLQTICHKNEIGFNTDGLRPLNSLTEIYLQNVRQYKFERISMEEIRRTDLWTHDVDILSNTPNDNGEYINAREYIERRIKHKRHLIFGTAGNEIWYGGRTNASTRAVNEVWQVVESRTAYRKSNFTRWPLTDVELKHYLAISVDNFSNSECTEIESSVLGLEGELIYRRRYKVDWENDLGLDTGNIFDVKDKTKTVDIRELSTFLRSNIIQNKYVKD